MGNLKMGDLFEQEIKDLEEKIITKQAKYKVSDTVKADEKKYTEKDVEELKANMLKEVMALKSKLELLENSDKIKRFSASADYVTYTKLVKRAEEQNVSISKYVRNLLFQHFKNA